MSDNPLHVRLRTDDRRLRLERALKLVRDAAADIEEAYSLGYTGQWERALDLLYPLAADLRAT